jgi:hypothetical protein
MFVNGFIYFVYQYLYITDDKSIFMKNDKRGQITLGQLPGIGITLLVVAITLGVAVIVLDQFGSGLTGVAAEIVGNITLLFQNMVSLFPTYGTILGAAVIIGVAVLLGIRAINR